MFCPGTSTLADGRVVITGGLSTRQTSIFNPATGTWKKSSWRPEMWPGGVPEIMRSFRASLAYRLCLAAEGRFDGMLTLRDAWEWDIAAGSLIAERAGAVVTDRLGRDLQFNRPTALAEGVLALPPKVHAEALQRLTSA